MCPSVQCLPIDLTDDIIDEVAAFSDTGSRSNSLSSLALTSHAFRHRVCKHRFREIVIRRTRHVRLFADLLNTDSWPKDEQFHAYIRNVTIHLRGSYRRLYAAVNGTHMRSILNKIFRRYSRDQAPAVVFYFGWDIRVQSELINLPRPWNWTDFDDKLRRAFLSMIQNSCVTELVIYDLKNVPRDLVLGCRIPALEFSFVEFSPLSDLDKSAEGIFDSWHLENINKFTTNHSTSPRDYIGTVAYHASSAPSPPVFPNLKWLICCFCNNEEYEMTVALMQRAPMLETLELSLPEPNNETKHLNLSYNHLLNLKTLQVTYYNPLRPLAPNYPELVQNVVDFFMPNIPSVSKLILCFSILSMNNHSTDAAEIFARHNFSPIDNFFATSLPPTLKSLHIEIEVVVSARHGIKNLIGAVKHDGRRYARRFFPRLSKLPFFYLTTRAFVCLHIDEQHYSSEPGYNWKHYGGIINS